MDQINDVNATIYIRNGKPNTGIVRMELNCTLVIDEITDEYVIFATNTEKPVWVKTAIEGESSK